MAHRKNSDQTVLLLSLADNATLTWYNSIVLRATINLAYYLITFSKSNMLGFICMLLTGIFLIEKKGSGLIPVLLQQPPLT